VTLNAKRMQLIYNLIINHVNLCRNKINFWRPYNDDKIFRQVEPFYDAYEKDIGKANSVCR
jgi:hypothetical protein